MLEESLLVGKSEWKDMKAIWKAMKESVSKSKDVLNCESPQIVGKLVDETYTHEVEESVGKE